MSVFDDSIPIEFVEHPRDTLLGMTLLIEAYIPEATPEQVNKLALAIFGYFAETPAGKGT